MTFNDVEQARKNYHAKIARGWRITAALVLVGFALGIIFFPVTGAFSIIPAVFLAFFAFFIGIIMSICLTLDIPMKAIGKPLDLTGYQLVWSDEFEGDAVDQTKWRGHGPDLNSDTLIPVYGATDTHEALYYSRDCVEVKDGNLILSIRHADGSDPSRPKGWYCASLDTAATKQFSYGYFECRAILAKAVAGNSAFWLNSPSAYDTSIPKEEGNEIDIMESMRYGVKHEGSIENNIHYYDKGGHQKLHARWVIVDGNPYEEFHTYGMKWDSKGYTFYVDGKECRNTDFGLSHSPEYIVLDIMMRDFATQSIVGSSADFVVDYVHVYQQQ